MVAVVLVAAGRGRRLGGEMPKQYLPLEGRCSMRWAADAFLAVEAITHVLPVIHPDDTSLCEDALKGIADPRLLPPVPGADTRARSVRNGLEALSAFGPEKVLIHDAARPFITTDIIEGVISALDSSQGACAALPVVDAIWQVGDAATPVPVPRDTLWRAQTPQGFNFDGILAAHRTHNGTGADDVAVAVEAGLGVTFVTGSERNYKITTADDYARALIDAAS